MASILFETYKEMVNEKNKALLEAEDDNNGEAGEETPADPAPDDGAGDNVEEDINPDGTLEDDGGDMGDDDNLDGGTEEPSMDNGSSNNEDSNEEPNKDNTNIFDTLSAEEQSIKIKELKDLYQQLYISCDDILERINNLKTDNDNINIINRLGYSVYDLKQYISNYIINTFSRVSYIENDITFNRFLMIIKSISEILSKYNEMNDKE